MNCSQEISHVSTQESSFSLLDYPKEDQSPLLKTSSSCASLAKATSCHSSSASTQVALNSKKQYVLKTCRFIDKRSQEIPFQKMFLTCLDVLIVESASEMDKQKENRYLASFNYFKRVINIERKILQDWICVNLQYVTMKKIPIKVMQQRLCNSKNKKGQKVSALLEEQLLQYNHAKKNNTLKTITTKQMESALQNKFCYFLEIDQTENHEDKMERLIYDFHVNSIYFSGLLSKLIAGDTSNLISHITTHGIPEVYSEDINYFDFWTERLSGFRTTINSSVRTFDNFNFKCVEKVRMFQSQERGTLFIQVTFDFDAAVTSSSATTVSSPSYSLSEMTNVYKFMKSERKSLSALMKNSKQHYLNDPFVNSIFEEEKLKSLPYKSTAYQPIVSASPSNSVTASAGSATSKNNSPFSSSGRFDKRSITICGFKELSEMY